VHRPAWLAAVEQLGSLITSLKPKQRNEKHRLTAELERAQAVLNGIDRADQEGTR
jgi:hypothetical protein